MGTDRTQEREEREMWNLKWAPCRQSRVGSEAQTHVLWDRDLNQSRTFNSPDHPGAPMRTTF